jgi:hypothetical protein
MWRMKTVVLATILVATAASCRFLPSHAENGPSAYVDILAVGDSYTAGNAATAGGDDDDGYFFKSPDDPRADDIIRQKGGSVFSLTKDCFRNHNNYSETLYRLLGSSGAYINGACSGDKVPDVISANGSSGQLNGFTTRQQGEVDLITLTIGGNDLGFANVVQQCFIPASDNAAGCEGQLAAAESILNTDINGFSLLQLDTIDVLTQLANIFPNAKIVLVGYPLFMDDDTGEPCQTDVCAVHAQDRLESGLNDLNVQQQEVIDHMNGQHTGRFAFLPLHNVTNTAFFDHHGIGGNKPDQWIQNIGGTLYKEEWVHPTAIGHAAIAHQLQVMPFIRGVHSAKAQANPNVSITKVNGTWYFLDQDNKLWLNPDVHCMMRLGFKAKAWTEEALFAAAKNDPPFPTTPNSSVACAQPGFDADGSVSSDGISNTGYWRRTSVGYNRYERSSLSEAVAQCHWQRGINVSIITGFPFFSDNPDNGKIFIDDTCWLTQQPVRDANGTMWMVETWPSDPPTATVVRGDWMQACMQDESNYPNGVPTVNLSDLGVTNPDAQHEYQDARCYLY